MEAEEGIVFRNRGEGKESLIFRTEIEVGSTTFKPRVIADTACTYGVVLPKSYFGGLPSPREFTLTPDLAKLANGKRIGLVFTKGSVILGETTVDPVRIAFLVPSKEERMRIRSSGEQWREPDDLAFLGLDVLLRYLTTIDGPREEFEISKSTGPDKLSRTLTEP